MKTAILIAAATGFFGFATQSEAALASYSDLASFASATSSTTLLDFEGSSFAGLTAGTNVWSTRDVAGFSIGDATFTVTGGTYQAVIAPAYYPTYYDRGTGNVYHAERGANVVINFSSAITSFAFELSTIRRFGGSATLQFSNGDSATASFGDPLQFHGFVSDTAFTSVSILNPAGSDYILFDNVRFGGNVAPVPLPAGLPLMMAGVGALALLKRRKKRQG